MKGLLTHKLSLQCLLTLLFPPPPPQLVTVTIKEGETVDEDKMLKKLEKWGAASGKTVARV